MSSTATSTYTRKRTCSFSAPSTTVSKKRFINSSKEHGQVSVTGNTNMGVPSNNNNAIASSSSSNSTRGSLKRSESCWDLPSSTQKPPSSSPKPNQSYKRTLRHYKEQRDLSNRHKQPAAAASMKSSSSPSSPQFSTLSLTPHQATVHMPHAPKTSSPLSPTSSYSHYSNSNSNCSYNGCRRSTKKPEPDLYKQAIITRMRCNPEGARILHMGPRLALSIMEATKDLERLVGGLGAGFASTCAAQASQAPDAHAMDVDHSPASQSWIMVNDDRHSIPVTSWEMVY
ncbi:hypothetical protein PM082_011011 [Marasmius tenuissimus]|nr:hypothetical protein PM082_011011 [Marasmius tenuissimus]